MNLRRVSTRAFMSILVMFVLVSAGCNITDSNRADVTVINNTGESIKLVAGDYSKFEEKPHGDLMVAISADNSGTPFNPTTEKSVNIWHLNSAENFVTILTDQYGEHKEFEFEPDVKYILTIDQGTFTLTSDSDSGSGDGSFSRSFPSVSRSAALATNLISMNAAHLNPVQATVTREDASYGKTTVSVHASFKYDYEAGDLDTLSFPQARATFYDADGNSIYNTTLDGGDGFKYIEAPYTSRYFSTSSYYYNNNYIFPGDTAYLRWYAYFDSDDTTHPLYGIEPEDVAEISFDLISSGYSNINYEKLTAANGGLTVTNVAMIGGNATATVTNHSASQWWQLLSFSDAFILDSQGRLLSNDYYIDPVSGYSLLVEPGGTTKIYVPIPSSDQGSATSALFLLDYEEGVPLGSSIIAPRSLGGRELEVRTARESSVPVDRQEAAEAEHNRTLEAMNARN
ncbi:hypothetical protein [Spirochaeta lutea]|uniref:Uncharacterized protein n=1 Tax=Spirochaeta lutea TaxID=1480694 RepID=A0A098QSW2_9SPIO|nr:hypothetical protein [Spirochaeta lutea]KGE70950.1 hypothetical protein DC28_13505 [Spirochaeta lutea]